MATGIQVGQRVRILPSYGDLWVGGWGDIGKNMVGTEFTVTRVVQSISGDLYVEGDPQDRGILVEYIEAISKAQTTTFINTTIGTPPLDRMVRIGSGAKNVILSVTAGADRRGHGSRGGRIDGATSLTLEQAEEIARDLLARVAEIRGTQ